MTFLDFINAIPTQDDPEIGKMITYLNEDKQFPSTDDIGIMSHYLYKKLYYPQTFAFQQLLMIWIGSSRPDLQPNDPKVLAEINLIIDLQNADSEYVRDGEKKVSDLVATKPTEYIAFFPADFPTNEGDVYVFFFVDGYSSRAFMTGIESRLCFDTIQKHFELLMKDQTFIDGRKRNSEIDFTIVMHKFQEYQAELDKLLEKFNGKTIIDDPYVAEILRPVLEHYTKALGGSM